MCDEYHNEGGTSEHETLNRRRALAYMCAALCFAHCASMTVSLSVGPPSVLIGSAIRTGSLGSQCLRAALLSASRPLKIRMWCDELNASRHARLARQTRSPEPNAHTLLALQAAPGLTWDDGTLPRFPKLKTLETDHRSLPTWRVCRKGLECTACGPALDTSGGKRGGRRPRCPRGRVRFLGRRPRCPDGRG